MYSLCPSHELKTQVNNSGIRHFSRQGCGLMFEMKVTDCIHALARIPLLPQLMNFIRRHKEISLITEGPF